MRAFCRGRGTSRAINLRAGDRHPLRSVRALVAGCGAYGRSAPTPNQQVVPAIPKCLMQPRSPVSRFVDAAQWLVLAA
jgi:hypothetical protein